MLKYTNIIVIITASSYFFMYYVHHHLYHILAIVRLNFQKETFTTNSMKTICYCGNCKTTTIIVALNNVHDILIPTPNPLTVS